MAVTLYGAVAASVTLYDGTIVELNTNGSTTLALRAFSPPPAARVTSLIASYTLGTAADTFAVPTGPGVFTLAHRRDVGGADDVFIIGPRGGSTSALLVAWWRRDAAGVWSQVGARAASIPDAPGAISSLAALYIAPPLPSGRPVIFVIGRRVAPRDSGGTFFANVNLDGIYDGNVSLFASVGANPSWMPALMPGGADPLPPVDMARVGPYVALLVDQDATVSAYEGRVQSHYRPPTGVTTGYSSQRVRVIGTGADSYVTITAPETGDAMYVTVKATSNQGVSTVKSFIVSAGSGDRNARGGTWGSAKWDAYYNAVADEVVIYYISATDRQVRRFSLAMGSLTLTASATVSSVVGTAGATLSYLRVQRINPDERSVMLSISQTSGGVESTQYVIDTSGNVAPTASNFLQTAPTNPDAGLPITLSWGFGDRNPRDSQRQYRVQVQRVSDSVNVVDSGVVTSSTQSFTIAAGTLVNGVAYRWRVLTYDQLGTAGTYSAYVNFTPNSVGSVTITEPATDDPAGINTAQVLIKWNAQAPPGYEPTGSWSVRVFDAATGEQLHAAGGSTYVGQRSVPVPTDRRVRVRVEAPNPVGTPVAERYFTSSYSLPMPATPVAYMEPDWSMIGVAWVVPALAGSRPATVLYIVERRAPDETAWQPLYSVPATAVGSTLFILDPEVASGREYRYRVRSYAAGGANVIGDELVVAAPSIIGAWMHRTSDPVNTLQQYPHAASRKVDTAVASDIVQLLGRRDPIAEYGESETVTLGMTVTVPHGKGDDPRVAWWRTAVRARETLCYRDNRQRLYFVALQSISESDVREGTAVTVTLTRVPFTREPVSAAP